MNKELGKILSKAVVDIAKIDPTPQHDALSFNVRFIWIEKQVAEYLQDDNQSEEFYNEVANIFMRALRDMHSACEREGITLEALDD